MRGREGVWEVFHESDVHVLVLSNFQPSESSDAGARVSALWEKPLMAPRSSRGAFRLQHFDCMRDPLSIYNLFGGKD